MITIFVRAITNAKKPEIIDLGDDLLGRKNFKVKTDQIAVQGRANLDIIKMIANFLKVRKSQVKIVSGELTKNKIINILDQ